MSEAPEHKQNKRMSTIEQIQWAENYSGSRKKISNGKAHVVGRYSANLCIAGLYAGTRPKSNCYYLQEVCIIDASALWNK